MSGAGRHLALLAGASAAFTLVGSLVPFDFQGRPDAAERFLEAMTDPLRGVSKSDAVVNVLLGLPLGFALLGAACGGRRTRLSRAVGWGMVILPGCVLFVAAVEYAQLYIPTRVCSGFDVIAQGTGAVLGMAGWLAAGPWLVGEVQKAVAGTGTAHRFLAGYVVLLGFIQALPLDLTARPDDIYRKYRGGGVQLVPFGEFGRLGDDEAWRRVATLLALGGLYLPVGLLAAAIPGRFGGRDNVPGVLLVAFALAAGMELGQVVVRSRTTSATDVVVGGVAAFLGWSLGKTFRHGLTPHALFFLGAGWWAAMVWISWSPFVVEPGVRVPFGWVPGGPLEGGNPLRALEAMLTKLVLLGLGGALLTAGAGGVAGGRRPRLSVPVVAALLGGLASGVFEYGQTWFVGRTPCLTDVFLGGLGAYCGAWATGLVPEAEPGHGGGEGCRGGGEAVGRDRISGDSCGSDRRADADGPVWRDPT